jgi:preprotein translocase subunit SecA
MREGEAIESKLLSRQIERAQRKVEAHNFDIRKQLLEYDDVANDQRKVVYQQRTELMKADEIAESVTNIREEVVGEIVAEHIPPGSVEEMWDIAGLTQALESEFSVSMDLSSMLKGQPDLNEDSLRAAVIDQVEQEYQNKVNEIGAPIMREFEKVIMLQQLDSHWKEHLAGMDYLRQGIHLRGYAQKNPKQEYKREAFEMFSQMLDIVKRDAITILSRVQIRTEQDVAAVEEQRSDMGAMRFQHAQAPDLNQAAAPPPDGGAASRRPVSGVVRKPAAEPEAPFVRTQPKVGRNEPCPCGSGKKYKQCHGRLS